MDANIKDAVRTLDPFGFLIGHGSAIRSLGGTERGPDPRYVFHTPYVEFPPGRLVFHIRFDGLKASFGELQVNINAFIQDSGRDAVFVTSSRLHLSDRAAAERGLTISILSVAGAAYAAYGFCTGGTDASATGLTITVEELEVAEGRAADELLLPTRLGTTALEMPSKLIEDVRPSFRDPVSQAMTDDQFAEPDFIRWAATLPRPLPDDAALWELAFIAQVLARYEMLRPGGRGLAFGDASAALAPAMAAAGCEVLLALPSEAGIPDFAADPLPCARLDAQPAPDGALPAVLLSTRGQAADQRGFDFVWSLGLASPAHAAGNLVPALLDMMKRLRPGGYAIHLLDMAVPSGIGGGIPRAELERTAITLISRGFSVAQLNFGGSATRGHSTPFGLIVRKG